MFWLFQTRNPMVIAAAVSFAQGIMFGPEAAWVAELFTARLRYSGASLGFQIGAALSGGLTDNRVGPPLVDRRDVADLALPDRSRGRDSRRNTCSPRNGAPVPRLNWGDAMGV